MRSRICYRCLRTLAPVCRLKAQSATPKRAWTAARIAACTAATSPVASMTTQRCGSDWAISRKPWRRRRWNSGSMRSKRVSAPGRLAARESPALDRQIEDKAQIRLEVSGDQAMQRLERVLGQAAAVALIGDGGIREAVGDHPLAALQRRPDGLHEVDAACRHHQQRLRLGVPALRQALHQKLADLLRARRAARLPGADRPEAGLAQTVDQQACLS